MRIPLAIIGLICAVAVSGCGRKELRDIRSTGTGPDEFLVLPPKPLSAPEDYTALPTPTPGGQNRSDVNPQAEAVVALGANLLPCCPATRSLPAILVWSPPPAAMACLRMCARCWPARTQLSSNADVAVGGSRLRLLIATNRSIPNRRLIPLRSMKPSAGLGLQRLRHRPATSNSPVSSAGLRVICLDCVTWLTGAACAAPYALADLSGAGDQ